MFRATTPTHTFNLIDFSTEDISKIIITYKQGECVVLEKNEDDCVCEDKTISVTLTQQETCKFFPGKVDIQLRVLTADNKSMASKIFSVDVREVLNDEEMT